MTLKSVYHTFKKIDKRIPIYKMLYYSLLTILMIRYMDNIDNYIEVREDAEWYYK